MTSLFNLRLAAAFILGIFLYSPVFSKLIFDQSKHDAKSSWSLVIFNPKVSPVSKTPPSKLSLFKDSQTGLYAYEDDQEDTVISPVFPEAHPFGQGLGPAQGIPGKAYVGCFPWSSVYDPNTKLYGFRRGEDIIEKPQYPRQGKVFQPVPKRKAPPIDPKSLPPFLKSHWFILGEDGEIFSKCFEKGGYPDPFVDGLCRVVNSRFQVGGLDDKGVLRIPQIYLYLEPLGGPHPVWLGYRGGQWKLATKAPGPHGWVDPHYHPEKGSWGLIDRHNRTLIPFQFDKATKLTLSTRKLCASPLACHLPPLEKLPKPFVEIPVLYQGKQAYLILQKEEKDCYLFKVQPLALPPTAPR